ncbi:hypothetical protein R1flu_010578 [Riccia fluitans]|uniref:Uncharacterized protein n=1 Tax=Riccia fluitans TaxID=41844 RepID=A0ABD1Z5P7_9MARC
MLGKFPNCIEPALLGMLTVLSRPRLNEGKANAPSIRWPPSVRSPLRSRHRVTSADRPCCVRINPVLPPDTVNMVVHGSTLYSTPVPVLGWLIAHPLI